MVGDMNCPGPNSSSVDEELAECFESLDLTQLVTEPTRRTPNVANLLDVFATSSAALVTNINITDVDHLSDHRLITADVVGHVPKTVITYTTTTNVLLLFVRDNPGEPVPEETLTHPPS